MLKICHISICLLFFTSSTLAQIDLRESDDFIHAFSELDSQEFLDQVLGIADDTRIIGMGEVSHYTKECYELKGSMIDALMKKGYSGLVLEVDFGQALYWNEYVINGKGDLDKMIAASGWFTYRTIEFKNILKNIREYNKTASTPFQVFGMEMTAMDYNLSWIKEYFAENSTDYSEILELLAIERSIVAFNDHSLEEKNGYWELFHEIQAYLKKHENELLEKGGQKKLSIARRIAEIMRQYATYISQDDFGFKVEIRDQFSVRNLLWALDELGDSSQIILWAHNGHVAKESVLFGYDILGHYLSSWFGEQYYSIGFTFNQGEFGAFSNEGFRKFKMESIQVESITKQFDYHGAPFLFFDIRENLKQDKNLESELRKNQVIRTDVGEYYDGETKTMEINLARCYDLLIYIDKTNYPQTIEWIRE